MGKGKYSLQRASYLFCTFVFFVITICLIMQTERPLHLIQTSESILIDGAQENGTDMVLEWMENRKSLKSLSNLGRILFLDEDEPTLDDGKKFQILIWKYGPKIESRHLKGFGDKILDPFAYCPVKNCDITYKNSAVGTADIVIFHLHRTKSTDELPIQQRNPDQIWAFLTDESPHHTFLTSKIKMKDFNGIFNWSMTYRLDSDIPVPYGRTVLKNPPTTVDLLLNKRRDVLVAILGSNCGGKNKRWDYVKELQKHMKVDVYGRCGDLKTCPGHYKADCPDIGNYLFYLSFENSNCDNYITEKVWWNAYEKNSIPIVMGAKPSDYKMLLPPDSYINIDDFASPAVLAQYIYRLNATEEYKSYFKWKKYFEVLNEHGYFRSKSFHYCRICQALNYNSRAKKVYYKLNEFWNVGKDCHPAWNEWN